MTILVGSGIYYSVTINNDSSPPVSAPIIKPSTNTPITTIDWETYSNSSYNFEIKFPPGWNLVESPIPGYFSLADESNSNEFRIILTKNDGLIGRINTKIDERIEESVRYEMSSTAHLGNYNPRIASMKKTTIAGIEGFEYLINLTGNELYTSVRWIYIPHENYLVTLWLEGKDLMTMDQILSTIQFRSGLSVTGILRTSGLRSEEKSKIGLTFANYQVTDFGRREGIDVWGYFLEGDEVAWRTYEGKCVTVSGTLKSGWDSLATQTPSFELNGQFTYNRLALLPTSLRLLDMSACDPYSAGTIGYSDDPTNKRSYTGKIRRSIRPAPDIGYDYELELAVPVDEDYGASGLPQKTSRVTLVPVSSEAWQAMEGKIDVTGNVEGYKSWGYAESQFLAVTMVK